MKALLTVLTLFLCAYQPALSQEKDKGAKKERDEFASPKSGRPGELTPEEEDRLDRIIDRLIQHDIGRSKDPQAVKEFLELGTEAIPALIRGLNRSAKMSHSCPVSLISKKLKQLLTRVTDEETLTFMRENVGAGLNRNNPYEPLLRDLRVTTMLRQRQVNDDNARAARQQQQGSPGSKGPGSPE